MTGATAIAAGIVAKVTVLFVIGAIAVLTLRRRGAAARHAVWVAALAGSIAVPVVSIAAPSWDGLYRLFKTEPLFRVAGPGNVASPPLDPSGPGGVGDSLAIIVGAVWLIGVLGALLRIAAGAVRVRGMVVASSSSAADRWTPVLDAARQCARVHRPVRLLEVDDLPVPVTSGVWQPAILLPRGSAGWTERRMRTVLLHELAHVRRRDCATEYLALVACAFFWFHPLVRMAAARMRVERERACDDAVLLANVPASDYADELVNIAALARHSTSHPALAFSDVEGLERRIRHLFDDRDSHRSLPRRGILGVSAIAMLVVTLVATAGPGGDGARHHASRPVMTPSPGVRR